MRRIVTFFHAQLALITVVLVAAGIGGYLWYIGNGVTENLYTVAAGDFVQEVSISGRVTAVDDVVLGFQQGGRVGHVYVEVGDRAVKGQVLAETENDDVRALILQRRAALLSEEANLDSLQEGTRPEEIAISEAAVSSAEVALGQSRQALVEAVQDAFRAADNAVRVQADQFISNARTSPQLAFNTSNMQAKATTENQRASLESVLNTWEIGVFSLTVSNDTAGALDAAKKNLAQVATFLSTANMAVNQGVPTGSVTAATLETYAADIATARAAVNASITALTTAETAQKSAEATLESAQKTLVLKQAGATASSVAAQEAKVEAARAAVLDAEAQLKKTFISAPFDGVITRVDTHVGEAAAPNAPVIALISDDVLQIESYVPEINVAFLKAEDEARVTLDAYGDEVVFPARVVSIDPAETIRDGVSTYRTILNFTGEDARVKAGMTANITVVTARKQNIIAVPRGAVYTENGTVVYVKSGDATIRREVVTGLVSSFGTIEILSGVSVGEQIVLP